MDIKLALMTGVDIPIPECQLILHQPTIKEISMVGEKDFFIGAQSLCIDKKMFENTNVNTEELTKLNNFKILTQIFEQEKDKKLQVQNTLTLLFPKYKIMITPRSFLFNDGSGSFIIDEGNFDKLQDTLRAVLCLSLVGGDNFNPQGKKAQEIAAKLNRARQRVAAQKTAENGENSLGQYVSVVTVGIHSMSLQDTINLTMYQLYDLMERYGLYTSWNLDIRSRLAGGSSDSKPENWMKPLH